MTGMSGSVIDIDIACLCAAWCRLCEAYEVVLEKVLSELMTDGVRLRRHWIDIEDDAEVVGDFDVETFPTLVVIDAHDVRFAGPLTPHPDTLRRLLRVTIVEAQMGARWPSPSLEVQAFAARLRGRAATDV
jgi:thioredoxin 1